MSSGSGKVRDRIASSWGTLLVGLALALAAIPTGPEPAATRSDYAILLLGGASYDSHLQRLAHQLLLVGVALAFLAGPRLPALKNWWKAAIPAVLLVAAAGAWDRPFLGIATLCGAAAWHFRDRLVWWPAAVVVPVVAIWYLPALLWPPDLSDPGVTYFREAHYSAVFDPGHRLALGQRLYADVTCQYGTGPALLVAWKDRLASSTIGSDLALLRASQVAAAGLLAWTATRSRGGAWWGILAALAAFPAVSNADVAPNISGMRYLGLVGAVVVVRWLPGLEIGAAAGIAGALAVLGLVYNVETGFAVVAGAGAWVVTRRGLGDLRGLLRDVGLALSGAAVAVAVAAAAGVLPGLESLREYSGGFMGARLYLSPVVLAAAGHAVAILVRCALSRAPASPRGASRAALAAMLVTWLAYFANRPHPSSEIGYLALWGLLVADQWPAVRRATAGPAVLVRALALLVLAPAIGYTLQSVLYWPVQTIASGVTGPRPGARFVSGVWLDGRFADALERQAGSLAPGDRMWLTAAPYHLARVTGRYPELRPATTFSLAPRQLSGLVERLRAEPEILVQDVREPSLDAEMAPFFRDLPGMVAPDLEATGERPGWVVLGAGGG